MVADANEEDAARRLVAAIAGGDQASMERFYGWYEKSVYAFALARLSDPHAAADVVNDVMLAVWRGAQGFKGESKVQTWLLGIAHHKVMDILRSRARHAQDELNDDFEAESAGGFDESVETAMDYKDVLKRCLNRLSDPHRQVVHLAFFEDLSYTEIAEIAQCPSGTVKTRMYHAKLSMKRCLEGFGLNVDQI